MIIDRIKYAAQIARGKRVLDIGGAKMPGTPINSPFAKAYAQIVQAAKEYRIVDYQNLPSVDYVLDFNHQASIQALRTVFAKYNPDVILCMEILEHINYHFELMNVCAEAVQDETEVFITLPNITNWIFCALNWNQDHSVVFTKAVAQRFIQRSELGKYTVRTMPCMGKYCPYWPIVYVAGLFQPCSWGFYITKFPR